MTSDYTIDRFWADTYMPAIEELVRKVAPKIISLTVAPDEDDITKATDYLITVETGTIACRIRRSAIKYRDFTIRNWRKEGKKTELEKLKSGFGKWYIYAWARDSHDFERAIIVDLDKVRKAGLLEKQWQEVTNKDGVTGFIAIPLWALQINNCIVEDIQN